MVQSPSGARFSIDVKGLYKPNYWAVKPKNPKDDLFYVFAFVPEGGSNRFYVLPQAEVNARVKARTEQGRRRAIEKGKPPESADKFPCLPFELGEQWKDNWDILPD